MNNFEKINHLLQDFNIHDLPISIYITTREGQIVDCNQRARTLLGVNQTGPISKPITDFYRNCEERERIIKKFLDQETLGELSDGEILTFWRNGEEIQVRDYCKAILDPETQEVIGFLGCLADVTLEQRYHQLFERLPVGIYRVDENNILTHVNNAIVKMFKYESISELEGRKVEELYADPSRARELRKTVQGNGYTEKEVVELVKGNGEKFYASVNAFQITDLDGNDLGREGTIVDTTKEELYLQNLNLSPVGFYQVTEINGEDIITFCNQQFAKMFEFEGSDQAENTRIIELYADPEEYEVFRSEVYTMAREGEDIKGRELRVKSIKGKIFPISIYTRPIQDRSGHVTGRTGVVIDVTKEFELRQREERLKRDLNRLMNDVGRALHPFTPNLMMIRQSIDNVLQLLSPSSLDYRYALTIQEADSAVETPVTQLIRSLEKLLDYNSSEQGQKALSMSRWQELSNHQSFLRTYRSRIKDFQYRPSALRTAADQILEICREIEKGNIAREPVKQVCSDAHGLKTMVLCVELSLSRSAILDMDHMVHSLRDYLTAGYRTEEPEDVYMLQNLIDETVQHLFDFSKDQRIEIQQRNEIPRVRVRVVRREVVRALQNLLHNAIKYSWDPGPTKERFILIHTRMIDNKINITFENFGVPITQDEISQRLIFNVGYRGSLSHDRNRAGTGIGLADAYTVAQAHDGDIVVTSKPASPHISPEDYTRPFITRVTFILPTYDTGG